MGFLTLREPGNDSKPLNERRYAIFSTYSDIFMEFNQTPEQIADFFAELAREEMLHDIKMMEETLEKKHFSIWDQQPFDYYLRQHIRQHCKDEAINEEVVKRKATLPPDEDE